MKTTTNEATYTIKAGTIVHIHGIPLEVLADVAAFTAPENIALIDTPPTVGGWSGVAGAGKQ